MDELKEVSKVKHRILSNYFPTWATILGKHPNLVYVDCFAGAGKYEGNEPGSPLIIYKLAKDLIKSSKVKNLLLVFIEKNEKKAEQLQSMLDATPNSNKNIRYYVYPEDADNMTDKLLDAIPENWPAFFFIDPYGHPVSFPVIRKILEHPRREVLLNLMWYRINMDLGNPKEREPLNKMFGHINWRSQPFINESGGKREEHFLDYVEQEINAEYSVRFRIMFSPEDAVRGIRTKYYLLHFSNHFKAASIMKSIMYRLGDDEGTFDYSATYDGILFSRKPKLSELKEYLIKNFYGKGITISFEDLQKATIKLHFIEKHYRKVILEMEDKYLTIKRTETQRRGIKNENLIVFK